MGKIEIDDSRFPLVIVTFSGSVENDVFEVYLARMSAFYLREQVSAVVLDASRADRPSAVQRKLQAEWMKREDAKLRRWAAGAAFVITSPLVRGALTAILWLQTPPQPYVVVASLAEAEAWAIEQLRQRAARVPPAQGSSGTAATARR